VVVPASMDELCNNHGERKGEKKVSLNQCQALPNCTLLKKWLTHSFISTAMKLVLFQLKHKVKTTQLSITDFFVGK
jgi:hypothetical protein